MDINAILEPILAILTSLLGEAGVDTLMGYIGAAIEFIMGLLG